MPSKLPITIPKNKLTTLCQHYQIKQLSLFGSVLRQDFNAQSDIDILVTFQPTAKIGFIAFNRLQRELVTLLKRPVDLVPQEGLKPLIKKDILNEAKVIYAT